MSVETSRSFAPNGKTERVVTPLSHGKRLILDIPVADFRVSAPVLTPELTSLVNETRTLVHEGWLDEIKADSQTLTKATTFQTDASQQTPGLGDRIKDTFRSLKKSTTLRVVPPAVAAASLLAACTPPLWLTDAWNNLPTPGPTPTAEPTLTPEPTATPEPTPSPTESPYVPTTDSLSALLDNEINPDANITKVESIINKLYANDNYSIHLSKLVDSIGGDYKVKKKNMVDFLNQCRDEAESSSRIIICAGNIEQFIIYAQQFHLDSGDPIDTKINVLFVKAANTLRSAIVNDGIPASRLDSQIKSDAKQIDLH